MLGTLTSKFSKNIDFLLYFVSFAVFLCCIMCIIHPFGYVSAFILGYMEVDSKHIWNFLFASLFFRLSWGILFHPQNT